MNLILQQKNNYIPPKVYQFAPEKLPSQRESSLITIIFQGLRQTSREYMILPFKKQWKNM